MADGANTTLAPVNELAARIAGNLRFYDIANLGKQLANGPLGIDFNRAFKAENGPTKIQFANWLVQQPYWDAGKAQELLPALEKLAGDYYATRSKKIAKKIAKTPTPKPVSPPMAEPDYGQASADAGKLADAIKRIAGEMDNKRQDAIMQMVMGEIAKIEKKVGATQTLKIIQDNVEPVSLPRQHKDFIKLLKLCKTRSRGGHRLNVWMTGPAGSGKTTAAANVAKALSLPFYFCGAVNDEYKLLGFMDAQGRVVRTPFREAFEHGGVFLLDEIDGCHPSVVLALNAALANGMCDFADGNVQRHPDCVIVAAANTWGTGATHEYVGRTKLDAASLDRFAPMEWAYDEEMELALSGNEEWARKVQGWRRKMMAAGIKHVISPRATYNGADMLAAGIAEADVIDYTIRKGLPVEQWNRIK